MKNPWTIVSTPGKPEYFSLVRGFGNDTEWYSNGPYGTAGTPAAWAFHELAEEKRKDLEELAAAQEQIDP